ncbi:GAF domain-containing protein [Streptomyces hoynatensis]|uniref:GAF domain-containing protein n=1 Tax=Streptomyces hoynatensis TaxID=1141874 RepID=A0A3A9YS02_9ACTN|nr:GAF domain-containing protein [Streptomyces hoynatensis]RKN38036.1 GAF domain-containing protein [Streptomyces hoynatensis]
MRREALTRLLRAVETVGGDATPRAVPDLVVRAAAELAGARYAALALLDEDGTGIGRLISHGPAAPGRTGRAPDRLARWLLGGPEPEEPGSLAVPLFVHGAKCGALQVAGRRGGFAPEDRLLLRVLAAQAGAALGNARLREAVRRQARWMDGSLELSTSLLAEGAEDPAGPGEEGNALAVVAEQAGRLTDAAVSAVLEPARPLAHGRNGARAGAADLEVVAAHGRGAGRLLGTTVPAGSPALGQALSGEPVLVDDPLTDPRLVTGLIRDRGPAMLLPLGTGGTLLGVLALARDRGAPPYSVPERALATQFAQQAALALLLGRARRDRARIAVLEDRDRIARDLHDLVIQRLFAVGMTLEGARRAGLPEEASWRLESATRELDATVEEIRTTIYALRQPPQEAPPGLRARVLREAGAAAGPLGFTPSVSFTGPVDALVAEEPAAHLIAALREGLSNAARHAAASRVEVSVDATARLPDGRPAVRLRVTDDGSGPPAGGARRSGLRNLAERAASLGGSAGLGPGPDGRGSALTWQVPR